MNVYVAKNGRQLGPFTLEELDAKVLRGEVSAADAAWIHGWDEWRTLASVPGFSAKPAPPPLPEAGFEASPAASSEASSDAVPMETGEASYLYIPIARLVFMNVLTLGLYNTYWLYRNWQFLKETDGLRIQPFWRAVFGIFFVGQLIHVIKVRPNPASVPPPPYRPALLAAGWIATVVTANALGQQSASDVVFLLTGLLSAGAFLFLLPVQQHINRINESISPPPPFYAWTWGQMLLAGFGIVMWLSVLTRVVADQ